MKIDKSLMSSVSRCLGAVLLVILSTQIASEKDKKIVREKVKKVSKKLKPFIEKIDDFLG